LLNRVMSRILENTSGRTPRPSVPGATSSAPAVELAGKTEESTEVRAPGISPQIAILNPDGARELVLIIDDEPEIAEFASTILAEEGYKVIVARDGFEALKIFQQMHRQIGLIILDFFLPVMDGDAVFEELKALNPSVNRRHAGAGASRIYSKALHPREAARTGPLGPRRVASPDPLVAPNRRLELAIGRWQGE